MPRAELPISSRRSRAETRGADQTRLGPGEIRTQVSEDPDTLPVYLSLLDRAAEMPPAEGHGCRPARREPAVPGH
jgi:hypothetical protein